MSAFEPEIIIAILKSFLDTPRAKKFENDWKLSVSVGEQTADARHTHHTQVTSRVKT
jgi:hypothetical protein